MIEFKVPYIFIPGNVPSSKNSKRIVSIKGRPLLINSKLVMDYKKKTKILWDTYSKTFKRMIQNEELPYKIGVYIVRDSRRRFDYLNSLQVVLDLMQDHGWLDDDDSTNVIPVFTGFDVDKNNAGIYLFIIKDIDHKQLIDKYL